MGQQRNTSSNDDQSWRALLYAAVTSEHLMAVALDQGARFDQDYTVFLMDDLNTIIQELSAEDAEAIAVSVLSSLACLAPNWTDQPYRSLQAFLALADSTRDRIRQVVLDKYERDKDRAPLA